MGLVSLFYVFMPISVVLSANSNCNFFQKLEIGKTYYIYNNEYPNNYTAGSSCQWLANSPSNTNIIINCNINIPNDSNCKENKLSISITGDDIFKDAQSYCSNGNFTLLTESNRLAIGLFTTDKSSGGKFLCSIKSTDTSNSCNCGWKQGIRIVGGHETGVNEYPAMAGMVDSVKKEIYCGATIIASWYALTAAHCMAEKDISKIGLIVGEHDTTTGKESNATKVYRLKQFIIHPLYEADKNDIAIIKTISKMTFSISVGPICLPFKYKNNNFNGEVVTALGWGLFEFGGRKSNLLQSVDLNVFSNQECQAAIPDVTSSQLCTYTPGKDTCQMDSGGPLLYHNITTNRLELVGIISSGIGCASNEPSVDTRVTEHLDWIVSSTPDALYCNK